MNEALLGAKREPLLTAHAVVPFAGTPAGSTHRKAVPPHACTSMPRWVLYHERSLAGSFARMNTPPIPVTRFKAVGARSCAWVEPMRTVTAVTAISMDFEMVDIMVFCNARAGRRY